MRETLFNWLTPYIVGARCLDLFAGSGALGFEALSRGAQSVCMIDQSDVVVQRLRENVVLLSAEKEVQFLCTEIPTDEVLTFNHLFDIVFLDPPFRQNHLSVCCQWLEDMRCLAKNALIYIEAEKELQLSLCVPEHWRILRDKKAGQVGYYLVRNS